MQLFRKPAHLSRVQHALPVGIEDQVYTWVETKAVVAHPAEAADAGSPARLPCVAPAPGPCGTAGAPRKLRGNNCCYSRDPGAGPPLQGKGTLWNLWECLYSLISSILFICQYFHWWTQSCSLGLMGAGFIVSQQNLTSCWYNTVFLPTVSLGSFIGTSILSVLSVIYSGGYFHIPGSITNSKELACPVWLKNRFNSQKWIIRKIKQFCISSLLLVSRSF